MEVFVFFNIYAFSRFRFCFTNGEFVLIYEIEFYFFFRDWYDLIRREVNLVRSRWNYEHIVTRVMFLSNYLVLWPAMIKLHV